MEKILILNNHTVEDLAKALLNFFEEKNMDTFLSSKSTRHYVIEAISKNVDTFDKYTSGDEIKCFVEIKSNNDGKAVITVGNGSWMGKITATALALASTVLVPGGGLLVTVLVAGNGILVGKNIYNQASLPDRIYNFCKSYLA